MTVSHRPAWLVGTGMDNERTPFATMVARLLDSLEAPDADAVVVRWTDGRSLDGAAWGHSVERMLVQSACAGDDEALDLLLRHEWYGVYRLVASAEPDGARVEELVQEVFARAIAGLERFRALGVPFRSYLAQIARRLLRPAPGVATPAPGGIPGDFGEPDGPDLVVLSARERPAPRREPAVVVLSADERPQLLAALDRLPRQCRELLWLRLVEGRTETEIGVEWGRTAASVRELQRHALESLRAGLADGAVVAEDDPR